MIDFQDIILHSTVRLQGLPASAPADGALIRFEPATTSGNDDSGGESEVGLLT